jgi:nuclear polyadenylated RNA-binding protein 3
MTPEPPEFHTKTLSPLSPLPVHPPEPSSIPVLRNQIDPVFNMTSTHIDPQTTNLLKSADSVSESIAQVDSSPSDSSFSDAYKEQSGMEGNKDERVNQGTDVSDDYAMTFDSDGEEQGDIEDVSQANIEPKTIALPATVPDSELSSSPITHDTSVDRAQTGPDTPATQPNPPFARATTADTPSANPPHTLPAQTSVETAKNQAHSYDDVSNGGIDIQQLLDNITANAEKNEPSSTPTQSVNTPLPKGGSGLPAHASLPPRPQIPQKRPNPYQDDIQKYHATTPGVPQNPSSFRPPGVATSLIAAGAPGTSTDPRGGLPPPPSASFRPPPQTAASPMSPASYSQINRSSGQDHLTKSIESRDEADDIDQRWGPDVQKLYDKFLEDERMYVTEGLWDRFPLGSRLFIGKQAYS